MIEELVSAAFFDVILLFQINLPYFCLANKIYIPVSQTHLSTQRPNQ